MTETITTGKSMEISMKENGVIVDMTPAALLHHNALTTHGHALRTSKDNSPDESTTAADKSSTMIGSNSSSARILATSPPTTTFRCERCDSFETNSRAALLLHVVQCLSNAARLKSDESDAENLTVTAVMESKLPAETQKQAVALVTNGNEGINAAAASSSSSSTTTSSRKVFECDVCNMKFSNGANMRRHKMRHTGVKPYECRVCQKRFFRKDHLAEHFTTHTKTLPYHCPICNRGFQRQIAMRAHFQNEHVGQHDLVKTCPLCSYRAGSMKSLRIHFFNRHGIDLDNPGPGGTSSLLLALESQASQVAAAAAAAGFVPGLNAVAAAAAVAANMNANASLPSHQSDSGESLRSMENATPPMHFLTPHVEISTLSENGGADLYNGNTAANAGGGLGAAHDTKVKEHEGCNDLNDALPQDSPMDCNTKMLPSSTSSIAAQINAPSKSHSHEGHIQPSISLIPIKQEPYSEDLSNKCRQKSNVIGGEPTNANLNCESDFSSATSNKMTSLIKVSPLKSLLREDLKRRICAKANNRLTRNAAAMENNNIIQGATTATTTNNNNNTTTPICNGTITSSGQETESSLLNRKQILTCHFCGIEFPDETLYFLHKGCHCESNPWKCNICGEQCNNVYEFNSHLLSKSHQ